MARTPPAGTLPEITRESEFELLRALLDRAPFGFFALEPVDGGEDFRFVYTNPAFEDTKPCLRKCGRTYAACWPEDAEVEIPRLRRVLETGQPLVQRSVPSSVEVASGVSVTRYYTYSVMAVEIGGSVLLIGFVNDVTDEREMHSAVERAHEKAQQELEMSTALLEASVRLAGAPDLQSVVTTIADTLLRTLRYERATVLLADEATEIFTVAASKGHDTLPQGTTLPIVSPPEWLKSEYQAGKAVVIDAEANPALSRATSGAVSFSRILSAAMVHAGQLLGLIVVDDPSRSAEFSGRDFELIEGLAAQAAVAVHNAQQREIERDRTARWQVLAELADLSASPLDAKEVIEQALVSAELRLGAVATSVWTLEAGRLHLVAARGFPTGFLSDFPSGVELSAPFPVARAAATLQPVLFEHVGPQTPIHRPVVDAYARHGITLRALAAIPLIAHGEAIGGMTLAWDEERRFDEQHLSFLTTLAERFSAALENARLFEERALQARYAEALNRINSAVHATLSANEVMERIVQEMSSALDVDASLVQLRREGYRKIVYSHGLQNGIGSGRLTPDETPLSALIESISTPLAIEDIMTDERAEGTVLRRFGLRSVMGVPLTVRAQPVGALFVGRLDVRSFTAREMDFALKVASTASLAIENASLYEGQRGVADRLQESLLSMPDAVQGVEFAHAYRSATAAARVGGDFYDVFGVDNEHVWMAIGDVAGNGLEAAVLTSLVRNTVRAHASDPGAGPREVLALTGDVLYKATAPELFVTVFLAVLECRSGRLTYSSAGHTTTVVIAADGSLTRLEPNGMVLGAFQDVDLGEDVVHLGENDLVVLYTDGLIESRRGNKMYGEERLDALAMSLHGASPEEVVRNVLGDVLEFAHGELNDDAAMLVVRRTQPGSGEAPAREVRV